MKEVIVSPGGMKKLREDVEQHRADMAIVANGNTHAPIGAGQFVDVKSHPTLEDGVYRNKLTTAIEANTALSTENLESVSSGALNALKAEVRLALKFLDTTNDATFALMLNGENTTEVFSQWWPSAWSIDSQAGKNRYDTLTRWFKMLQESWAGKKYTVRFNDYRVSGSSEGTPLDDLAGKTAAVCATDVTTDTFDWADEDPMTWYVRGNALSLANGTMNILAVEGVDDTFDITGNLAPVYTFRLGLFKKHWTDGTYEYKSFVTVPESADYKPWAADIDPTTNNHRTMDWQATFGGSLTSDGKLTSGSGYNGLTWRRNSNTPATGNTANAGLTKAKLWDNYEGLFSDTDLEVILDLWQLRHFNLENSGIIEGCLNYGGAFRTAIAEEGNTTRITVTAANGAQIMVGSFIKFFSSAIECTVLGKQEITIDGTNYCRIYLDLSTPLNIAAEERVDLLPWLPGSTEHLPGHKDGAIYSCTDGKAPARIAGVEVIDGAYAIGLDPLWQNDYDAERSLKSIYTIYQVRDSEHQGGSISEYHEESGTFNSGGNTGWHYIKHHEIRDDGMIVPDVLDGSSATYLKSGFCFGAGSDALYCAWHFGSMEKGNYGGLAGILGIDTPSTSSVLGRPRLSGSGKKRGKWTANSTY